MSLKAMSCDTPSTGGTTEQGMYWGVDDTDISTLPNLNQAPYVGTGSSVGNASSTLVGQISYSYLPSDKFSTIQCPHDTDAYYYRSSSSYYQAPSPYLTDGSRNPAYYQTTSPSSSNNALADFNGKGNTQKIITQRGTKDYDSWKPTSDLMEDYPAASCCDIFHTEGTQQGDWYLPACGELGYIMPPFNKINDAIDKVRTVYGSSVGVELDTNYYYWSSTEYGDHGARVMDIDYGCIAEGSKDGGKIYVRAFLRVSSLAQGLSPESAPNGVYVYANNGKLYNPDDWDTANNDLAVGVAIITNDCKFVVDKFKNNESMIWSTQLYETDVEGLINYGNSDDPANKDFDGENNTNIIISAATSENSSNNAAIWCNEQTITVNNIVKHGYLGAIGEWKAIGTDEINNIITKIGGTIFSNKHYWSSTEYSDTQAWRWAFNYGGSGFANHGNKIGDLYVRPFYSLI